MNTLKKVISGLKRRKVIFKAYMIHERDSEFEWKPELAELCENYYAKIKSDMMDVAHESLRLDLAASGLITTAGEVPESLLSKIENIDDLIQSGMHWRNKVFNITISVNPEELKERNIGQGSLEKLRDEATKILEDSDPWYLLLE